MQKFIFPILTSVLVLLFGSFLYMAYGYYEAIHSDDPIVPYVMVNTGNLTIGRGDIAIDMKTGEKYNVNEDDILMSKSDSIATIYWPDHSTTRVGSDSRATIRRMRVSSDYSSIEMDLILENGKVWNNVVRTMYPKSYFRTHLPENNVIAGVRGTVYEINLDKKYIHSVNHGIALSDGIGRSNTILPGEIVATSDIMKKLSQTVIDMTWVQMNTIQDAADNLIRSEQVKNSLNLLSSAKGGFDSFVRWILSFFSSFRDIRVVESFQSLSGLTMEIPREYMLKWYQRFQSPELVDQREHIRATIVRTWTGGDEMIDTMVRGAIWDKMSYSGVTLGAADTLIKQYTDTLDTQVRSVLNVVPVSELQNKARETLRTLIK